MPRLLTTILKKLSVTSYLSKREADTIVRSFRSFGEHSKLPELFYIKNPQYISIGSSFSSLWNLRIEAWDYYEGNHFTPQVIIGNNVSLNSDCHIGCINKIVIGNNVLLASRVYISDHSHGNTTYEDIQIIPAKRKLVSKGPVIIEDNVWIGQGAAIMPNVVIGKNAIIGANAVVTKNVPPFSVAAGIPAKIIKELSP